MMTEIKAACNHDSKDNFTLQELRGILMMRDDEMHLSLQCCPLPVTTFNNNKKTDHTMSFIYK